jgi:hyaluronan synthase
MQIASALNTFFIELGVITILIPIGILGFIRWMMWLAKMIPAAFYHPVKNEFDCTATLVTPVYNEDPELFRMALDSWIKNNPNEIIAVIDVTDKRCAEIAKSYPSVRVMMTDVPGKRDALARGVDATKTDIVVLVDSDVVWEDDVLKKLKMPFADEKIGGVGTRQNMRPTGKHATFWERMADIFLDMRYTGEVPATVVLGKAMSCLSGRTAAYRTKMLQSFREDFLNETFAGHLCLSGDDKRYTVLTLKAGYRTHCQLNARVTSTFKPDFKGFVRQRIRWARNSLRSDIKALWDGWVWRFPFLAIMLFDKTIAPFLLLVAPIALIVALFIAKWELALGICIWWMLSRTIKLIPHLVRKPHHILLVPGYILTTFLMSLIKAYALFTINKHEWLTRDVAMQGNKAVRATGGVSS